MPHLSLPQWDTSAACPSSRVPPLHFTCSRNNWSFPSPALQFQLKKSLILAGICCIPIPERDINLQQLASNKNVTLPQGRGKKKGRGKGKGKDMEQSHSSPGSHCDSPSPAPAGITHPSPSTSLGRFLSRIQSDCICQLIHQTQGVTGK